MRTLLVKKELFEGSRELPNGLIGMKIETKAELMRLQALTINGCVMLEGYFILTSDLIESIKDHLGATHPKGIEHLESRDEMFFEKNYFE